MKKKKEEKDRSLGAAQSGRVRQLEAAQLVQVLGLPNQELQLLQVGRGGGAREGSGGWTEPEKHAGSVLEGTGDCEPM